MKIASLRREANQTNICNGRDWNLRCFHFVCIHTTSVIQRRFLMVMFYFKYNGTTKTNSSSTGLEPPKSCIMSWLSNHSASLI